MTAVARHSAPAYQSAPTHPREAERIRALHSLQILDTPEDPRFDRLTALAADLFGVPNVSISLVDEHRQWFLSHHGLNVCETDRDIAFCSHAIIDENNIMVVEDARLDPRFAGNPLVVGEPHIRFYAGAVIHDRNRLPLGTLCLIGPDPRGFSDDDKRRLTMLAELAQTELLPDSDVMAGRSRAQLNADIDPLTRARWRKSFANLVQESLKGDAAQNAKFVSLDIANLQFLKDIFGLSMADALLIEIADRLFQSLRPFGKTEIGRIDDGEFAVLLTDCDPEIEIATLEKEVAAVIKRPVETDAGPMMPEISIGVSNCSTKSETSLAIELEKCRMAINATSATGRITTAVSDEQVDDEANLELNILAAIPKAIESGAFHLAFQPKVDAVSTELMGMECLLRWEDETLGAVSPLDIIAGAEKLNLIQQLDHWVIDTSLAQMADWRHAGLDYGAISVNLSGPTLMVPHFSNWLKAQLRDLGIPATDLDFEIVERSVFEDFDATVRSMAAVKDLGVTFSLDDFGTGYSSLAYLKQLPVNTLKIDRTFVRDIVEDPSDAALCAGIVGIARNLGLTVVAEGVETEQQHLILRAYRCDQIQGYYFSKPMIVSDATPYLEANRPADKQGQVSAPVHHMVVARPLKAATAG